MKRKNRVETMKETGILCLFTFLTTACLLQSEKAAAFAANGLNLWFQKMIPTLLPFMILSGILIRMNLSDRFARLFSPLFKPVFRLSDSCIYILIIGFLCGFPMGARVTAESLRHGKISKREASLMLAFCNNIGPIYFTGYVLKLFPVEFPWPYLAGMYLIPLLYGLFLRYTVFRDIPMEGFSNVIGKLHAASVHSECCEKSVHSDYLYSVNEKSGPELFQAMQEAIASALVSQATLGGYMILFNLLNLIPDLILPARYNVLRAFCGCLLEITGGLSVFPKSQAIWAFTFLQFGGLSCIAQTNSMIQGTSLSLREYVFHKLNQMLLTFCYYLFLV